MKSEVEAPHCDAGGLSYPPASLGLPQAGLQVANALKSLSQVAMSLGATAGGGSTAEIMPTEAEEPSSVETFCEHGSWAPCVVTGGCLRPEGSSVSCVASFLEDLQAPLDAVRQRGARNLRVYVEVFSRDASVEAYTHLMESLCNYLHSSIASAKPLEVFSVLLAIDVLVLRSGPREMHEETNRNCCARFFSFLRQILRTHSCFALPTCRESERLSDDDLWNFILISRAAGTLARVAREGTRLRMNCMALVDYALKQAFSWLAQKPNAVGAAASEDTGLGVSLSHRLTALFLLKEFAHYIPMIFQGHLHQLFSQIWVAIQQDADPVIREAGIGALRAALRLLSRRDSMAKRLSYYWLVWRQVRFGLNVGDSNTVCEI